MALDDGVGDSLFKNIRKVPLQVNQNDNNVSVIETKFDAQDGDSQHGRPAQNNPPLRNQEEPQQESTQAAPKWQTLDKVMVLLTTEQKEGLDRIAKKIMKYRSKEIKGQEKERITANTLIRALIDNFLKHTESEQPGIITSEEDAREWIERLFK